MSGECMDLRPLLGVYVLGAIEPAERALVDAHLARCRRCRDELAGLAALPALLGRVTEDQIAQAGAPPRGLLDAVLARAVAEHRTRTRRSRRWLAVATAAVLVTGGAGLAGGLTLGDHRPVVKAEPTAVGATTVRGTDKTTGVSAQITLQPKEWGTAFVVRLTGAPEESRCRLVVVDRTGRRDVAGSWHVEYEGSADFYGSSMIPKDRIASVEVRTVDGRRLLNMRLR